MKIQRRYIVWIAMVVTLLSVMFFGGLSRGGQVPASGSNTTQGASQENIPLPGEFQEFFNSLSPPPPVELSESEFYRAVEGGQIKDAVRSIQKDSPLVSIKGMLASGKNFTAKVQGSGPRYEALVEKISKLSTKEEGGDPIFGFFLSVLSIILPLFFAVALISFVFSLIIKRNRGAGDGGVGGAQSFLKTKARRYASSGIKPVIKFEDVAGVEEAVEELREVVEFLKNPQKFVSLGAKIPRGVLLVGPPGCGKTLLARAVAGEAEAPYFSVSASEFVEMFVGVGASRVRDLFTTAKQNAPSIIFIDEIDAVGRQRGAGVGNVNDERETTLNQILAEMDGFDSSATVIVLAATNRPDVLDSALLRPGRFDRQVIVDAPDFEGRLAILKIHTKGKPLASNTDLKQVARETPGLTGADLANIVNEAAIFAARKDERQITTAHLLWAAEKVTMGRERKGRKLSERDRRTVAYHEVGHALVAYDMPDAAHPTKISCIPRALSLGHTSLLPDEDTYLLTREQLFAQLAVMFGGRVAEEIFVGRISTGAANDIKRATELARKMVTRWGMGKQVGPLDMSETEEFAFLGRDIARGMQLSDDVRRKIEADVNKLIDEALASARRILEERRDVAESAVALLLEKETLTQEDFLPIFGQRTL